MIAITFYLGPFFELRICYLINFEPFFYFLLDLETIFDSDNPVDSVFPKFNPNSEANPAMLLPDAPMLIGKISFSKCKLVLQKTLN